MLKLKFQLLIFYLQFSIKITFEARVLDLSTMRDQEFLVRKEQKILQELIMYTDVLEENIYELRSYLSEYSLENNIYFDGNQTTLLNEQLPLTSLLGLKLLQRLSKLSHIKFRSSYHSAAQTLTLKNLGLLHAKFEFPSEMDYSDAMNVLTQMTTMYELDLDDLEEGKILDIETHSGLDAKQFYELGQYFLNNRMFSSAVNYLDKARTLSEKNNDVGISAIYENMYKIASIKHDKIFDTDPAHNLFLFKDKVSETPFMSYKQRRKTIRTNAQLDPNIPRDYSAAQQLEYFELCREKHFPKLDGRKNLLNTSFIPDNFIQKCFLSSKLHPFWILNPMKVEVLSKDPFIVIYHDVLTSQQIIRMKSLVAPVLQRSEVILRFNEGQGTDASRISSTAVPDLEEIALWNKKAELYTGLKAMSLGEAEALQITSYPNGGFFVIHSDAFQSNVDENESVMERFTNGDRLATFMFYLSTTMLGGRTGFPFLDLAIQPEEGSALFWYNLYPDGTFDERVVHAGCPVLLGSKWIATKWIYSNAQMFHRKCSPDNQKGFNPWFYNHYDF